MSDKFRFQDKYGFPNNLRLYSVVDCYEEELVQEEVWDLMKKLPLVVKRLEIDGFIDDEFIGIHTLHPGEAVKSLSREYHEGIVQWKIMVKKSCTCA